MLEPVVGCGLIAQNADRNPLYHANMEALHVDFYTASHKLHGYQLNDALLLSLPQRIRSKSIFNATSPASGADGDGGGRITSSDGGSGDEASYSYQIKFQAFH